MRLSRGATLRQGRTACRLRAVRFVERMGFDQRCFTPAIIDLGVNGHIWLTGDGKQTVIEHRDGGKAIGSPEQALESKLFASKPSLLLDQVNYEPLGKARNALKERLSEAYDGTLREWGCSCRSCSWPSC